MAGTSTPFFLYPTGLPPVTVTIKGGVRSLFAFWAGGACGVGTAPTPSSGGGAGRPRKSRDKRYYEHRPNYDPVAEAYRSVEEAERRARELGQKKRKQALAAVRIAEEAIAEAEGPDLAPLTDALQTMARAQAVAQLSQQVRLVREISERILAQIEEEEVEMLLLSH